MDQLLEKVLIAAPEVSTNNKKTEKERIDAVLSHPLFMSNANDFDDFECGQKENEETINAIQSLVYDGTPKGLKVLLKLLLTNLEMAENFKHQGNACFKEGPRKFKNAIKFYTQAIECKVEDEALNSLLHSNRAAVNLELSKRPFFSISNAHIYDEDNFRSVLYDCGRAITLNPKNVKAYFRSAKALLSLERVEECLDCCEKGLALDPSNIAFRDIAKKAITVGDRLTELARLAAIKDKAKLEEAQKFNDALMKRNYKMKTLNPDDEAEREEISSLQHPEADLYRIHLHNDGELGFPVIFLYPEFNQSDVISSFREQDTFYSHFELMFENAAPWDQNHIYQPQNLDWYFETYASKYDKNGRKLVSALKSVQAGNAPSQDIAHKYAYMTLADILRNPEHTIVNGVVRIIIFSRSSSAFAIKYRNQYQCLQQL